MATNQDVKNQLANRKTSAPATPDKLVEGYMKKMAPPLLCYIILI